MDATGFSIKKYAARWSTTPFKHRGREFLKIHGLIDADSLAFLSWEITLPHVADTVVLPTLLDKTRGNIAELYADAGYLSSDNAQRVVARGATPFIKPRSNTRGRPPPGTQDKPSSRTSEAFRTMIDEYQTRQARWLARYGRRNGIESTWSAVKRRFNGAVTALSSRMRRIEAALKILVWNLTRATKPHRKF